MGLSRSIACHLPNTMIHQYSFPKKQTWRNSLIKGLVTSLFWLTSTSANPCRKLLMYKMFVHQKFRQFDRSSGVPPMTASRLGQLGKNLSYKVAWKKMTNAYDPVSLMKTRTFFNLNLNYFST